MSLSLMLHVEFNKAHVVVSSSRVKGHHIMYLEKLVLFSPSEIQVTYSILVSKKGLIHTQFAWWEEMAS